MINTNKWMFNFSADGSWSGEQYDSREEAVNEGINEFRSGIDDAGDPIDESHCEIGGEFFEGFTFKHEHIEELNDSIRPIVESWMKDHDYTPNYFLIQNTECIDLRSDGKNE